MGKAVGAARHVDGVRIAIQARCVVADGEEVAGAYRLLIVSKNLHIAVDGDASAAADDDGFHLQRIERCLANSMEILRRFVELRVNSGIRCCVVLVDGLLQGFCADAHLCGQVGDGVGFGNVGVSLGKVFLDFQSSIADWLVDLEELTHRESHNVEMTTELLFKLRGVAVVAHEMGRYYARDDIWSGKEALSLEEVVEVMYSFVPDELKEYFDNPVKDAETSTFVEILLRSLYLDKRTR